MQLLVNILAKQSPHKSKARTQLGKAL